MRLKLISVLLFCIGLFCLAQAQVPMTGAGKGAPGSGGGPLITLAVIGTNTNFAGFSVTTTVDCPVGSALFIGGSAENPNTTISTASDGTVNSYSVFTNTPTAGQFNSAILYSLNIAHDVPIGSTITVDGGASFAQAAVCVQGANSGIDTGHTNSVVDTSAVSSFSIATGTLTQANEIIFGAFTPTNTTPTYTEATGFTAIWTITGSTGLGFAYQIVSATTSVAYNPSNITATNPLTAVVAPFKH